MGDVIVASTTDTQEQVNHAAGGVPQDQEEAEVKAPPTGDQQVDSETPAPEPESGREESGKEAEVERKVPRGVDKRIDKLTREKNELAARVAELEAKRNGNEPEPEPQRQEVPTEIAAKFDTFDAWSEKQLQAGKEADIADFLEARDAWKEARDAQKAERKAIEEYQAEVKATYNARIDDFKADHPEWDDIVGSAEISIPPGVGPALRELDNGPAVVWYLATNPKEAAKLNEMSPFLAVAEVGRIAARLEKAEPESHSNATNSKSPDRMPIVSSKAPPPIRPLGGNALRSQNRDYNNMSQDEYNKQRDAEEKAARRR